MKKKKLIYAAVISAMLLSSCGSQNGNNNNTENVTGNDVSNETTENEPNETSNDDSVISSNESSTSDENTANEMENNPADSNADEASVTISIEMLPPEENNITADDGTLLYTGTVAYPVVTIEGNEAAGEKINADILARVEAFRADTALQDYAKEDYPVHLAEGYDFPFFAYEESMGFSNSRADSNVISFEIGYYEFSGGAHGNYSSNGVSYNAQTGDVISFSELSGDSDSFHADTLAYNKELARTEEYREKMFPEDSVINDDMEKVLYADGKWYLSPEGLVFISDPYGLGPYVSGTIEFLIPYGELEGMGFKAEYAMPIP